MQASVCAFGLLYSGLLHCAVSWLYTNVSDEYAASVLNVEGGDRRFLQHSEGLHGPATQTTNR